VYGTDRTAIWKFSTSSQVLAAWHQFASTDDHPIPSCAMRRGRENFFDGLFVTGDPKSGRIAWGHRAHDPGSQFTGLRGTSTNGWDMDRSISLNQQREEQLIHLLRELTPGRYGTVSKYGAQASSSLLPRRAPRRNATPPPPPSAPAVAIDSALGGRADPTRPPR